MYELNTTQEVSDYSVHILLLLLLLLKEKKRKHMNPIDFPKV